MSSRKEAAEALAAWREADRRMQELSPQDPEWQLASLDAELAKGRYEDAVEAARREQLPELPSFDQARDRADLLGDAD